MWTRIYSMLREREKKKTKNIHGKIFVHRQKTVGELDFFYMRNRFKFFLQAEYFKCVKGIRVCVRKQTKWREKKSMKQKKKRFNQQLQYNISLCLHFFQSIKYLFSVYFLCSRFFCKFLRLHTHTHTHNLRCRIQMKQGRKSYIKSTNGIHADSLGAVNARYAVS